MTIENNKKYKLTGEQIKDLASRFGVLSGEIGDLSSLTTTDKTDLVSAVNEVAASAGSYTAGDGISIVNDVISATNTGKAKVLTSADYNYPTNNPDGIAIWLLPAGIYAPTSSLYYYTDASSAMNLSAGSLIVGKSISNSTNTGTYVVWNTGSQRYYNYWDNNGSPSFGSWGLPIDVRVFNNLTSTSTTDALSANQGRILNARIEGRVTTRAGAPTTATVGTVGQLLEDTTNGKLYICTDATNPYVWEEVGAGGGGPTVVQGIGTSTTDVMSQSAATSMVFHSGTGVNLGDEIQIGGSATMSGIYHNSRVQIGRGSSLSGSYGANGATIIGSYAKGYGGATQSYGLISLGTYAKADATASIALGAGAHATQKGEMNIGIDPDSSASWFDTYGYNNSNYRLLTGLYDPQSAHDAATKGYVDGLVGNIASALNAINNGTGA